MILLNEYPYNTKKWNRYKRILNKLYKDFAKNRRKILKYTRLLNNIDISLSGRVIRLERFFYSDGRMKMNQFTDVLYSEFCSIYPIPMSFIEAPFDPEYLRLKNEMIKIAQDC